MIIFGIMFGNGGFITLEWSKYHLDDLHVILCLEKGGLLRWSGVSII